MHTFRFLSFRPLWPSIFWLARCNIVLLCEEYPESLCLFHVTGRLFAQVGVVEKMPKEKGGRKITRQGQQDCDRIATEIYASKQA